MNSRIAVTGLGLAALACLACGIRSCARGETVSSSPAPVASAPASGAPAAGAADAARAVLINSVVLGHSLSPDGSVGAPGTTFAQGGPLFVSLNVSAISPGTEVKLSWYGPTGTGEGDDQLVVPPGANVVNFRAKDTSAWPAGPHRVEIWVGGAKAGEKAFTLTPSGGPAAASSPH
jgi:hypothetical protein